MRRKEKEEETRREKKKGQGEGGKEEEAKRREGGRRRRDLRFCYDVIPRRGMERERKMGNKREKRGMARWAVNVGAGIQRQNTRPQRETREEKKNEKIQNKRQNHTSLGGGPGGEVLLVHGLQECGIILRRWGGGEGP